MFCSAFWCSMMPCTVTSCSSREESMSGGAVTADGALMSAARKTAVTARCFVASSPLTIGLRLSMAARVECTLVRIRAIGSHS